MSDAKKPEPLDDVKEGLGLLFRAAKTAVSQIPTDKIESAVTEGARDFGKALETVGETIEREVFGKKKSSPPPAAEPAPEPAKAAEPAPESPQTDDAPKASVTPEPSAPEAPKGDAN